MLAQVVQIITERGTFTKGAPDPLVSNWWIVLLALVFWMAHTYYIWRKINK